MQHEYKIVNEEELIMRKREKESLLAAFLHKKLHYERLGAHITRLIRDDPSAPKQNFHTITYRIKDEKRFIKKIVQN